MLLIQQLLEPRPPSVRLDFEAVALVNSPGRFSLNTRWCDICEYELELIYCGF